MTKFLFTLLLFTNLLVANKSYSINLAFPYNDELNQVTLRKDFKLSDNLYLCPSIGLIMNPFNLGLKYEQTYNQKGFVLFSSIGYSTFRSWTHGGKPGLFYHFSPSYQWKLNEYIYFNLGVNYTIYYDFEEEELYIPTEIEGESLSGIIPFLQLCINF